MDQDPCLGGIYFAYSSGEEDPKVARILVKGLESDQFAVDLVSDGDEGLQLAMEVNYDAIILDWNLPKLDGLSLDQATAPGASRDAGYHANRSGGGV